MVVEEILTALGISTSHLIGKHAPCPGCEGKDRFKFDDLRRHGDCDDALMHN